MRAHQRSGTILASALLTAQVVYASWIPDIFTNYNPFVQSLEKRCDNPCGYYGQVCCGQGQYCYTDANNQAQCGGTVGGSNGGSNGQWQYYTTTYVMTDLRTVTTTFSSFLPAATQPPTTLSCAWSQGQVPCGSLCCNAGQYCYQEGTCKQIPGGSSGYYSNVVTVTTVVVPGAPVRPTTSVISTLTVTGAATGTTAFQTPVGTGGAILTGPNMTSSGGLSGGTIAGIVIGVIAGILILLLICVCCCFKGLLDGLLAIFGLGGRKRRTEETYIEERHSHRVGGAATAAAGMAGMRRWFGQPAKTEVVTEKKKSSSGLARFLSVGAVLGGLAVVLGLKRKRDRDDRSSVSYSYGSDYTYDYTSDSSPSSVTRSRSRSRYSRR